MTGRRRIDTCFLSRSVYFLNFGAPFQLFSFTGADKVTGATVLLHYARTCMGSCFRQVTE